MLSLTLHKNVKLYLPHKFYHNVKEELNQIIVLCSLLDKTLYISDSIISLLETKKRTSIFIEELNLDLTIKSTNNIIKKMELCQLHEKPNGSYETTTIFLNEYNNTDLDTPYIDLLDSLIYVKNAL